MNIEEIGLAELVIYTGSAITVRKANGEEAECGTVSHFTKDAECGLRVWIRHSKPATDQRLWITGYKPRHTFVVERSGVFRIVEHEGETVIISAPLYIPKPLNS